MHYFDTFERGKTAFMNEEKLRKIHFVYGIIMSILVVFLGICFITSCITIYLSGERAFTRESVTIQLGSILVPILFCLLGIIGNVVLSFYPLNEVKKLKGTISKQGTLARLSARCDFDSCPAEITEQIKKEHKKRIIFKSACAFVIAVSFIICLIYGLNKNNFPSVDITDEVARFVIILLCATIVTFAALLGAKALCDVSLSKELEITKKALGVSKKAPDSAKSECKKCSLVLNIARGVILAIAIVFIIIGMTNGGMADVLGKAIRICTECIGLG